MESNNVEYRRCQGLGAAIQILPDNTVYRYQIRKYQNGHIVHAYSKEFYEFRDDVYKTYSQYVICAEWEFRETALEFYKQNREQEVLLRKKWNR